MLKAVGSYKALGTDLFDLLEPQDKRPSQEVREKRFAERMKPWLTDPNIKCSKGKNLGFKISRIFLTNCQRLWRMIPASRLVSLGTRRGWYRNLRGCMACIIGEAIHIKGEDTRKSLVSATGS